MRFSKNSLFGLGFGAAIFFLLVVLQVACSGSDDNPGSGGSGTPGATGSTGSSAPGSGEGPFQGPIEDGFTSTPLAAADTPATPFGIVLAATDTGDGEYWRVESAADQQGEYYGIDSGHRWLQWLDSAGQRLVIADRQTGESYALDTSAWTVVAGPSNRGVLVLQDLTTQTYAVVDLAADPLSTRLTFQLPAAEGQPPIVTLLGGGDAVLLGNSRIDLATGEVFDHEMPAGGFTASFAALDGGWLDVTFITEGDVSIASKRFDAGGNEIAPDAAPTLALEPNAGSVAASPDGRWAALSLGLGLKSPPQTNVWPTVAMADLQTGELAFRAVRVSARSNLRSLGWLQDSSGLLVTAPEGFAVLKTDGTLEMLPFGPVEQAGAGGVPVPVASPVDAGSFLYRGRMVTSAGDESGPEIASAAWAGTEPWNNYGFSPDGTELRFLQSQSLGRDYPLTVLTAFGIPSRIERPPFPASLELLVTEATSLHPSPDDSTAPRAELAAGDRVTVVDEAAHNASAWPDGVDDANFSVYEVPWWVYVSTPTGAQGWVRTEALAWP